MSYHGDGGKTMVREKSRLRFHLWAALEGGLGAVRDNVYAVAWLVKRLF